MEEDEELGRTQMLDSLKKWMGTPGKLTKTCATSTTTVIPTNCRCTGIVSR